MHSAAIITNGLKATHFARLRRSIRMKAISPAHYAVIVCAAIITLGGCGGSAQFPNPTAQAALGSARRMDRAESPNYTAPEHVGADSSSSETIKGSATVACGPPPPGRGDFAVKGGTATGPYPGTFRAKGIFTNKGGVGGSWYFDESFTIKSGSSRISGTISGSGKKGVASCPTFGPHVLHYATTSGHKGKAQITIIQPSGFNETLLRL